MTKHKSKSCNPPRSSRSSLETNRKKKCTFGQSSMAPTLSVEVGVNDAESHYGSGTSQPFPVKGDALFANLDLSLNALKKRTSREIGEVRSYVVASVGLEVEEKVFVQSGSGPNFQGGFVTLCTCKHGMRAKLSGGNWENKWIAGFSSRSPPFDDHWLFYLAQVESAHESHFDLWNQYPEIRTAKSARYQLLGDLFEPLGRLNGTQRFDPDMYHPPITGHSHDNLNDKTDLPVWHGDIDYKLKNRFVRTPKLPASLLVAKQKLSFIWQKPKIRLKINHSRSFQTWKTLNSLLDQMREVQ